MMIAVENGDHLGVIMVCEWLPGVNIAVYKQWRSGRWEGG